MLNLIKNLFASGLQHPDYLNRVVGTNTEKVVQLWEVFPWLSPFYSRFEKEWDADVLIPSMHRHQHIVYSIIAFYFVFVCLYNRMPVLQEKLAIPPLGYKTNTKTGRRSIPVRQPWLKRLVFVWNVGLSLFSLWGTTRTLPHLLHTIFSKESFRETVCVAPTVSYGHGVCGIAVQFFIISKIPELFDTVWLILKGKTIIFLHWYHHFTVLLFCWHSYTTESGNGLYFVAMNYFVHTLMYYYYAMVEIQRLPKNFPTFLLTLCQIVQMIVGTVIIVLSIYYKYFDNKGECHNDGANLFLGAIMYSSYLYLFIVFAIKKYGGKLSKKDTVVADGNDKPKIKQI